MLSKFFSQDIRAAYDEVLHWYKNIFPVPWDNTGKRFVNELSRLFKVFAEATALEEIALEIGGDSPSSCCCGHA